MQDKAPTITEILEHMAESDTEIAILKAIGPFQTITMAVRIMDISDNDN